MRVAIFLFLLAVSVTSVLAQPSNNYQLLPSPDAYSLGKYYDMPVDKSSGLPSISVPLGVVATGSLSLPLSLSYHSAGLRVTEASSNVGLGWTLRGVPTISRSIQMLPDDNKSLNSSLSNSGYLSIAADLGQSFYQDTDYFTELVVDYWSIDDILVYGDNEPDVYTCTLLSGETFRFTIDGNGQPVTIPRRNVDISFSSSTGIIEVTDENGVEYIFDVFEKRPRIPSNDDMIAISAWYPSSISTFDGAYTINFAYEDNTLQHPVKSSFGATSLSTYSDPPTVFCIQSFHDNMPTCSIDNAQGECAFFYPVIHQKYLAKNLVSISSSDNTSKITFVNDFQRDDAYGSWLNPSAPKPKTFSKLQVWDQNVVKEEISFDRSYFMANTAMANASGTHIEEAAKRRLKLDGVTFLDMVTGKEKQYSFEYYGGNIPHTASPDYDYWGFFNDAGNAGQSIGANGLPVNGNNPLDYFESQTLNNNFGISSFSNPNIDKSSSLVGTRSTVLKSITYPTGGKTEFDYELNEFESRDRQFSSGSSFSLYANNCNWTSCNCNSYPSNTSGSASVPIESFYEFFRSELTIQANSNLTFYTQPSSCTTSPSCTLSIYKPSGGGLYKSATFNFNVASTVPPTSLSDFFDISIDEADEFIAGNYFFSLQSVNAEVTVQINDVDMSETSSVVNGPGLRISSIQELTNDGSLSTSRTFNYEDAAGNTSGVLFSSPKTNYSSHLIFTEPGGSSHRYEVTLYSESYIPLSNFEKGIGFYTRVTETFSDGASVVSEYEWENDDYKDFTADFPLGIPYNSSLLNKASKKDQQRHANQSIVQETTLEHEVNDHELIPGVRFVRRSLTYPFVNIGGGYCAGPIPVFYRYPLFTSNVRLKSKTTVLDGLASETQYSYRPDNAHLLPISEETEHPDGTVEKTETFYAADVNNTALLLRNLIHIPLEQYRYVGANSNNMALVSGQKTNYGSFLGHPRPSNTQSYNWQTGTWETEVTYQSYDWRGNPTQVLRRGWNAEFYTWSFDRLLTRTYGNFVWQYEYYPNSKLLWRHTEPNGLRTTYSFNGFRQLTGINQYNGKAVTSISYDLRETDGENKITSSVAHSDGADFTTEQIFDGLGRKVMERKVGYGHNNQDVVHELEYDNVGRLWKEYEPGFGAAPGAATIYTYEASPLNRATTINYPSPVGASSFVYGSENNLWTKTETNSLGQIVKTYTDTRGRQVKTIQGKSPVLAETNYYYDDRDNLLHVVPHGRNLNDVDFIYSYTYDGRNNVWTSKVPEKALMQMRYNTRDHLTHYQDGIQQVVHTTYDIYGRARKTGFVSSLTASTISPSNVLSEYDYISSTGALGFGQAYRTKTALLDPSSGNPTGIYMQQEVKTWDSYHRPILSEANHPLAPYDYMAHRNILAYNDLDQTAQALTEVKVGGSTWSSTSDFDYDHGGRLYREQLTFNGVQKELFQIAQFDARDNVVTKTLGGGLQSLNYGYYGNGFFKSINTVNSFGIGPNSNGSPNGNSSAGLFAMNLGYDAAGNIRTWSFQNRGFLPETNTYSYDGLNRILSSVSSTGFQNHSYSYRDLLGNIGTLSRTDLMPGASSWTSATIDNLQYTYQSAKSSKLQSIQDLSNHEAGFKPTALSYVYDNNGNITFEPQQQLSMTYNHINLPSAMQWPNGKKLETIYDASGKKWQQIKYDQDQNTQTRTYIAGMEFLGNTLELIAHTEGFIQNTNYGSQGRLMLSGPAAQDEQAQLITSTQQVAPNQGITYTAAGEVLMQDGFRAEAGAEFLAAIAPVSSTPSFQWRYAIRDHLGNTRVLFTDKNGDGLVRQSPDENLNEVLAFYKYAPFGLELSGSHQNGGQSSNRYRYNGKELEAATGFYEYGARWYDAAVGRFLGVDPLAEEFPSWSGYSYTFNNPIRFIDPDGRAPQSPIFGKDGKFLGTDSEGYSGDIIVMEASTYRSLTGNGTRTLDHGDVAAMAENGIFANKLNDVGMSVGAYSNVLTHVTERLSGESFDGTTLDFIRLEGGKIQIANEVVDEDGFVVRELHGTATNPASQHAGTLRRDNGDINITAVLRYGRNEDFGTVENVQNILGIHEYYGHGVKGLSAKSASEHRQVYGLQTQHRTYKKVTPSVIDLIKTGLE